MVIDPERSQKLHPFIERLVASDDRLLDIMVATGTLDDPMLQATQALIEALGAPEKREAALAQAAALQFENADPDVSVLLFYYWMHLSEKMGRGMEMMAIQRRARALVTERTPPAIRAIADLMDADIAFLTGDRAAAERIVRKVLDTLPRSVPRYKVFVWMYCNRMCIVGRGLDVENELEWLKSQSNANFPLSRHALAKTHHCIATGRATELAHWSAICEADPTLAALDRDDQLRWNFWTQLYTGAWTHGPLRPPDPQQDVSSVTAAAWSTYALLCRQPDVALQWARQSIRKNLVLINAVYFDAYALVRAELAMQHTDTARYLLELRRKRGSTTYFDDFFLARVEWQASNREKAAAHFAAFLKSVEYYKAEGRLDMELRLATDWSAADAMQLNRLADRQVAAPTRQSDTAALPAPPPAAAAKSDSPLLGEGSAIADVRANIVRFAPLPVPVLITGETGTGKDLVARGLHEASDRKDGPYIAVNCGAISETLLESELFGHVRGAFTGAERERAGVFQEAGAGTLFLDEIGEITPRLQVALLRVLESNEIRQVGSSKSRQVNCRLIFATNVDLDKAVEAGTFRKDLLYRLRRLQIQLPPLRRRPEDIILLATHFLNQGHGGKAVQLSPDLTARLKQYHWPGNVRELRNEMERMRLLTSDKGQYGVEDLADTIRHYNPRKSSPAAAAVRTDPASAPASSSGQRPQTGVVSSDTNVGTGTGTSITRFLEKGRSPLRRMDRLKELFVKHKKMTRSEIAHILKISPNTATRDLKSLCDEGFIQKVEPTPAPGTHYFVLNETSA